jgi:hypothetical protein
MADLFFWSEKFLLKSNKKLDLGADEGYIFSWIITIGKGFGDKHD